RSLPAGCRDAVQVVPSVLLVGEDNAVGGGEVERLAGSQIGQRLLQLFAAAPDFARLPRFRIAHPYGPRVGTQRDNRHLRLYPAPANERNLPPVRRPARMNIAIHTGSQIADRVAPEIVDGDEAVIAAVTDERDAPPVRRPARAVVLAAHVRQLLGGCG